MTDTIKRPHKFEQAIFDLDGPNGAAYAGLEPLIFCKYCALVCPLSFADANAKIAAEGCPCAPIQQEEKMHQLITLIVRQQGFRRTVKINAIRDGVTDSEINDGGNGKEEVNIKDGVDPPNRVFGAEVGRRFGSMP